MLTEKTNILRRLRHIEIDIEAFRQLARNPQNSGYLYDALQSIKETIKQIEYVNISSEDSSKP